MLLLSLALAVTAPRAAIHQDRLMSCIHEVEGHAWSDIGGAYGIQPSVWRQHMRGLPYRYASTKAYADQCAERHMEWLKRSLVADGYAVTVYALAVAWNRGFEGWRRLQGASDYGTRVHNLYFDHDRR